jgi:hypothetical protein
VVSSYAVRDRNILHYFHSVINFVLADCMKQYDRVRLESTDSSVELNVAGRHRMIGMSC